MFIVRSNNKNQPNWSGKEWSQLPCKIYSEFTEACDALKSYWFGGYNDNGYDGRNIIITPITEKKMGKLIIDKKIRW